MIITILSIITLIGIMGAISFLRINNGVESGNNLKASDFEIVEID